MLIGAFAAIGLGGGAVAHADSIALKTAPSAISDVIAGQPTEFRFEIERSGGSTFWLYEQPQSVPCAAKVNLQTGTAWSAYYSGTNTWTWTRTRTYQAATAFRLCGYLLPGYDADRNVAPTAAATWDVTVRAPAATLAVSGIPAEISSTRSFPVTFTATTEAPREVRFLLVGGVTCPPNASGESAYATSPRTVNGGPDVATATVDLSTAATGTYSWCGYVGSGVSSNVDQVVPLGSVTIVAPRSCRISVGAVRRNRSLPGTCVNVPVGKRLETRWFRYTSKRRTAKRQRTAYVSLGSSRFRIPTTKRSRGQYRVEIWVDGQRLAERRVRIR